MLVVDFSFYTNDYKGFVVPSDLFDFYSQEAIDYLIQYTPNATEEVLEGSETLDTVKKCVCSVVDELYKSDNEGKVSSEKVGTYSVSYKDDRLSKENKIASIIDRKLSRTGLLFGGVQSV